MAHKGARRPAGRRLRVGAAGSGHPDTHAPALLRPRREPRRVRSPSSCMCRYACKLFNTFFFLIKNETCSLVSRLANDLGENARRFVRELAFFAHWPLGLDAFDRHTIIQGRRSTEIAHGSRVRGGAIADQREASSSSARRIISQRSQLGGSLSPGKRVGCVVLGLFLTGLSQLTPRAHGRRRGVERQ